MPPVETDNPLYRRLLGGRPSQPQIDAGYQLVEVHAGLAAWRGKPANFARLGIPPAERPPGEGVSDICRLTALIDFHDSMIVFRRAERAEPWRQLR